MNPMLQERMNQNISWAIAESIAAKSINHRYLTGRIREIAVKYLLKPIIPEYMRLGSGKIYDNQGTLSKEIDVIVYSPSVMAPLLYEGDFGVYPYESVFNTIEVKSELNSTTLNEALESGIMGGMQFNHLPGLFERDGQPRDQHYIMPQTTLFAFSSDLTDVRKNEFDRYKEKDANWQTSPKITGICVIGKGTWFFKTNGDDKGWYHIPATNNLYIYSILRIITDTAVASYTQKGSPMIGHYIIDNATMLSNRI